MSNNNLSSLDAAASIKSAYYLDNNQYTTIQEAWTALKDYVSLIRELSGFTDIDEQISYNEALHTIQIRTKNKKLPLDRYVPIKSPVILDPLSGNINI